MGRVCTEYIYFFVILKRIMAFVWRVKDGVIFEPFEINTFMIQFFNVRDKERVFEERSWIFDDNL